MLLTKGVDLSHGYYCVDSLVARNTQDGKPYIIIDRGKNLSKKIR